MNARKQVFNLELDGRQIDEAVSSIFHSVLLHRTLGKTVYTTDCNYVVHAIGVDEVDCDFIDLTYMCVASPQLNKYVRKEISGFSEFLRSNEGSNGGQISLEFFQKKPNRWFIPQDTIPWEVWTVRLELIKLNNEREREICREKLGVHLFEKICCVSEIVGRQDFVPKIPKASELELVFNTSFADVQPYLFKFNYSTAGTPSSSVGSTMKRLIRESLEREN